ncbi:MAG: helix-turn-helix transcriptional regulator [Burkholderiales bacterium]|nr:helix-turn-helix transcriptional regulator [Burkholderiales bacterium]
MTQKSSFAAALRTTRKARGLSQEAFSDVSSRTYLSSLERGLKSPTLNKVAELCAVLEVHPLTLLTLSYATDGKAIEKLFTRLREELDAVLMSKDASKS